MRTYKGKTILVVANLFERDLPSFDRVAAIAICTKLPAVDVSVAIRASLTYILENETCVALRAGYLLMHATQWVSSLVVIEFRIGAYWFPARV